MWAGTHFDGCVLPTQQHASFTKHSDHVLTSARLGALQEAQEAYLLLCLIREQVIWLSESAMDADC